MALPLGSRLTAQESGTCIVVPRCKVDAPCLREVKPGRYSASLSTLPSSFPAVLDAVQDSMLASATVRPAALRLLTAQARMESRIVRNADRATFMECMQHAGATTGCA